MTQSGIVSICIGSYESIEGLPELNIQYELPELKLNNDSIKVNLPPSKCSCLIIKVFYPKYICIECRDIKINEILSENNKK